MLTTGDAPRWVRRWFRGSAVYGVVALIASTCAPPTEPSALLPHYAFVGTALAFQVVFWIVGGDPVRYRPMMLAGVAEKLAFGVPTLTLAALGTAPWAVAPFALVDLALGLGFLLAWRSTPRR